MIITHVHTYGAIAFQQCATAFVLVSCYSFATSALTVFLFTLVSQFVLSCTRIISVMNQDKFSCICTSVCLSALVLYQLSPRMLTLLHPPCLAYIQICSPTNAAPSASLPDLGIPFSTHFYSPQLPHRAPLLTDYPGLPLNLSNIKKKFSPPYEHNRRHIKIEANLASGNPQRKVYITGCNRAIRSLNDGHLDSLAVENIIIARLYDCLWVPPQPGFAATTTPTSSHMGPKSFIFWCGRRTGGSPYGPFVVFRPFFYL